MATAEVAPATSTNVAVTTDIKTFARVVYVNKVDADGNKEYGSKIVNEKIAEEVEKTKTFEGKEVVSFEKQSFSQPTSNTMEGWEYLIPETSERALLLANGAAVKLDNKARRWLSATDDDGNFVNAVTESAFNQDEQLKELSNRRKSPMEKLTDDLSSMQFTPAMLAQFEALLQKRKADMGI